MYANSMLNMCPLFFDMCWLAWSIIHRDKCSYERCAVQKEPVIL